MKFWVLRSAVAAETWFQLYFQLRKLPQKITLQNRENRELRVKLLVIYTYVFLRSSLHRRTIITLTNIILNDSELKLIIDISSQNNCTQVITVREPEQIKIGKQTREANQDVYLFIIGIFIIYKSVRAQEKFIKSQSQ